VASLILGVGGCAMTPPQEVVWMRQDIKGLQDQVRTLRGEVATPEYAAQLRNIEEQQRRNQQRLADRMVEIELQLSELGKQMRRVQEASEQAVHGDATTEQQLTRLEARATALEGAVQEVSARLEQARTEQRQALDQRLAALERQLAGAKAAPTPKKAAPAPKPAAKKPATSEAKPAPKPAAAAPAAGIKADYDAALKEIRGGDRKAGIAAMEALVKDHPHSDLTDNAYYWIGEGYYAEGEFESAILKFDDLLIRFPASDKVAGALLKTGMSFAALADKGDRKENLADAKLAFNQVIQRFPDSDEAKIARQQLAKVQSQ